MIYYIFMHMFVDMEPNVAHRIQNCAMHILVLWSTVEVEDVTLSSLRRHIIYFKMSHDLLLHNIFQ